MAKIFKCYSELDAPENMLFVNSSDIKTISSFITKDGKNKLFINYYNDEICIVTFFICDKIEAIDPDIDEDYKIWKNS